MGKLVAVSYSSNDVFYSTGVPVREIVERSELLNALLPVTLFSNVVPTDLSDHFVRLSYQVAHFKDSFYDFKIGQLRDRNFPKGFPCVRKCFFTMVFHTVGLDRGFTFITKLFLGHLD